MKKFVKFLFLAVAVLVLGYIFFYSAEVLFSPTSAQPKACFGSNCFFVELAKTQAEQEKGLMFRQKLDENKGMLFLFQKEGEYPFWMKNTLIPLDIIWINDEHKVVFINENSQPCPVIGECPLINPGVSATYVLEINAGLAKKYWVKIGDDIDISF